MVEGDPLWEQPVSKYLALYIVYARSVTVCTPHLLDYAD